MTVSRKGWTLVELLASLAVLALLLALLAQALAVVQRSWLAVGSDDRMQVAVRDAETALSQISRATLSPGLRYDASLNRTVRDSSLHFVCGPANELLPSVRGVCGDAVFFQQPGRDGLLQNALHASGFFVQFGDDGAWRPAIAGNRAGRMRFRLFRWEQAAAALPVFRTATAGGPSLIAQAKDRAALYDWFNAPLSTGGTAEHHVGLVAENVLALRVRPLPSTERCHDSRRWQWDGESAAAVAQRHRLPLALEITLLVSDEVSWAKMDVLGITSFATALQGELREGSLAIVRDWLGTQGINARTAAMTVPLADE